MELWYGFLTLKQGSLAPLSDRLHVGSPGRIETCGWGNVSLTTFKFLVLVPRNDFQYDKSCIVNFNVNEGVL